jgi:hypothetical protein
MTARLEISSEVLRTPAEWLRLKHPALRIHDPDGWRGVAGRPWDDQISEPEFDRRLQRCTVSGAFGDCLERRAEHKLEAIRRRALATPLTEDTADLRGFVLGITSGRRPVSDERA